MFDVAASLRNGLTDARNQLQSAAQSVARANADGGATDGSMARAAQAELFSEALFGAVHARLAEIKAVSRP
ncbi:MAG: hypothetical protein ACYDA5_09205 [Vulcanimicrobiaceae bacterium]